jgi:hypothetical protein
LWHNGERYFGHEERMKTWSEIYLHALWSKMDHPTSLYACQLWNTVVYCAPSVVRLMQILRETADNEELLAWIEGDKQNDQQEPRLVPVFGGAWQAHGNGWSVSGATREEAIENYWKALQRRQEILEMRPPSQE